MDSFEKKLIKQAQKNDIWYDEIKQKAFYTITKAIEPVDSSIKEVLNQNKYLVYLVVVINKFDNILIPD